MQSDIKEAFKRLGIDLAATNILMTKNPGTPSDEIRCVWLYGKGRDKVKPFDPQKSGKWLIFHPTSEIDAAWAKIWKACGKKLLGSGCKVSTLRSRKSDGKHVICCYTDDYENKEDVLRVRWALWDLGYRLPLYYKSDEMSRRGESGSLYRE